MRPLALRGLAGAGPALLAALLLLAAGGGAPAGADDPLARALAEQRARAAANPGDARIQNDLGNLLALTGDLEGAEAAYREALALGDDNATTHYNLGRLLIGRGERFAARRELKRALELDPANGAAHYYLGTVYDAWGFHRLARRQYMRAFALDPALADPARNPHVVDNRQALAAQLLVWSNERIPGPTRQYEQPARIASTALPPAQEAEPPAESGPDAEPDDDDAGPTGGGFARSTGAPPREALPPQGADRNPRKLDAAQLGRRRAESRRGGSRGSDANENEGGAVSSGGQVLDASSLQRRQVNQVVSPGGGAALARPGPRGRPGSSPGFQRPVDQFQSDPGLDSTGAIERSLEDPAAAFAIGA